MSEKQTLRNARYIENFVPESIRNRIVNETCGSVVDAFLGHIEYGKTYAVATELITEQWNDGFGVKCTYNFDFEEIVRCAYCRFRRDWEPNEIEGCEDEVTDGFCMFLRIGVNDGEFCCWASRRVDAC